MVLIRFPVVSTWIASIRKDKGRIFRLLVIIGLVIAFVYFDHTQSGLENQEVSDWFNSRDPLLVITSGINKSLRESPESVIYVATGILFVQYLMYVSLIIKYVGKGNLILVEVFTGWLLGVLIKLSKPLPRSSLAIDYAQGLPYPLQKYVDDTSFSTSIFLAIVCARRLVASRSDYLGKFALWSVVVLVGFFLGITYSTGSDAIAWAILVSIGTDKFRSWLAVKMRKRASTSLRAIFNIMHLEATRSLTTMKLNASGAWRQMRQGFSSNGLDKISGSRITELNELDVRFEEDLKDAIETNETGSVIYDPNAAAADHHEEEEEAEEKAPNDDDDQMSLHSVHSDEVHSQTDHEELLYHRPDEEQ